MGKRVARGAKARKMGGENGDASGAFIGAKELVKRPVSRCCLFFSAVGGVAEAEAGEPEISRAMTA